MATIATVENLRAYYIVKAVGGVTVSEIKAVDNVSFEVRENEVLGIAGESGCGKSTLMKVMYGLIAPPLTVKGGSVHYFFEGRKVDLIGADRKTLNRIWWKYISYIPQGSMNVLNPTMRVKDQFLDVLRAHIRRLDEEEAEDMILKHIESMGLPREVYTSFPHQLSGGMRQRVVIALATILKPKVILADEPTTALDVVVQRGVLQLLRRVQKELRNTLVVVTHDMGVHAQIADRMIIMYAGKVVEIGPVDKVFEEPLHPYTKYLIQSLPKIGDKTLRKGIPGKPPSLENPPPGCRFYPRCPRVMDVCKVEEPEMVEVEPMHYVACHLVR